MRKLKTRRVNQDGLTPLGLPIGGRLTYIQLYRKLKKRGVMDKSLLTQEIFYKCHWGSASPFVEMFWETDKRKLKGKHWESGIKGKAPRKFTPMRQTMLLLMAAYEGQL